MKIIAVIGRKGGSGKTTLCENLAVEAAERSGGKPVLLIDLDPQATAAKWGDRRQSEMPAVTAIPASRLARALDSAKAQGAAFVVLDTPPHNAEVSIEAAKVADLALVPLKPLIKDVETLPALRDLLRFAGDPSTYVVWTDAPIQGSRHIDARLGAEGVGLPICPVILYHRSAYADAGNEGQSASEFDPNGKAAQEVQELYRFISKQVKR